MFLFDISRPSNYSSLTWVREQGGGLSAHPQSPFSCLANSLICDGAVLITKRASSGAACLCTTVDSSIVGSFRVNSLSNCWGLGEQLHTKEKPKATVWVAFNVPMINSQRALFELAAAIHPNTTKTCAAWNLRTAHCAYLCAYLNGKSSLMIVW